MALGTNHLTRTTSDKFIPEVWEDDTIAAYKAMLVVANLVTKFNHKGKRGDVIHVPNPARGTATAKAANTAVSFQADTAGEITITINKHFESSYMIEDIVATQALSALRKFYTDDAGFALAKRIDQELHVLGALLQGGSALGTATTNYDKAVIGSDGTTLYASENGTALTDAGIRKMIQTLDDADMPMTGRALVIPPVEKKNLTGLSRYTEQAFVGEGGSANTIRTGMIGNVYGHEVFVSSNCPWLHTDDTTNERYITFSSTTPSGTDFGGTTVAIASAGDKFRIGMIFHKSAFGLAEQMGIRVQTQYALDFLGNMLVADTLFGTAELRNDAGVAFVVPS